jgi:hypothetical protein
MLTPSGQRRRRCSSDLPDSFPAKRERLLRLANAFGSLPEETREKYAREESLYSFGWSMGKEIMNGVGPLSLRLVGSLYQTTKG